MINGCRQASDLSGLWADMEQTARAGKPDIPMAILGNGIDLPNKLTIAVIAIAGEGFSVRSKFVQAVVHGAQPEIAVTVLGDALDRIAANAFGVVGVVPVVGKVLGGWIELVEATTPGANPQIPMAVFNQTENSAGTQRIRIGRVVFVHDERVAIIAIESVLGGEPHKAAPILQNPIDSIVG